MFYEIMRLLKEKPHSKKLSGFYPKAQITDRETWRRMDEQWRKETISLGETFLGAAYPFLSATDYMDFSRTGNRGRFEEKYFKKRRTLSALVLAECVEDEGRFLDDIINGIFSICEESAWQLPPHNTYVRDMPQLPLPDATEPVLDLFACETGAVLATVYYLLKERLDEVSPFIAKRIMRELKFRVFEPYLGRHFWWMGNGEEPMNNWTIWCTQNVLLSVFLTDTEEKLREKVLEKACVSADYFLAEYGEDGCCDEGAQYYRHAGLCLFHVLELLNAVTNDAFTSIYGEDKIKNIASYILNVHVSDQYYVNFADCSPMAGRAGVREFLFAERVGNGEMANFAAKDYMAGGADSLLLPQENNLFYRLENGMHAARIKAYAAGHTEDVGHKDIYYPSVGILIVRDERLMLAVKAGDNGDSHNHNDVGSFIVYKDGRPLLIDVGVESYTKKTFSPDRYEIWTMQSAYHNLPTVNGVMQSDGEAHGASEVHCYMDHSTGEMEMDIAGAYPPCAGLISYKRKVSLHKGKEVALRDDFVLQDTSVHREEAAYPEGSKKERAAGEGSAEISGMTDKLPPVILSLMVYEKPEYHVAEDGAIIDVGSTGQIRLIFGRYLKTETIPITDGRLGQTWKHDIYRILIAADASSLELRIR